jgi:hypothetical protein
MSHRLAFLAACSAALFLPAQDPMKEAPKGDAPQAAKPGPEHAILKLFEGDWSATIKCWEKPGAEPQTSKGSTQEKLVCNGFWLKSKVVGEYMGAPFQGFALTGYDPIKKKYLSLWIDTAGPYATTSEGTWDEKTRTLTTTGECTMPDGKAMKFRSTQTIESSGKRVEKSYGIGPDGKEFQMFEGIFEPSKVAQPLAIPAAAKKPDAAKPAPELALLEKFAGEWDCAISMTQPGAPAPIESQGSSKDVLVCNGQWLWTSFNGDFMGQPFEGHGVFGYDGKKQQYVGWWVDSIGPFLSTSHGTLSKDGKTLTCSGEGCCPQNGPIKTEEITTIEGDKRTCKMKSTKLDGSEAGSMTLVLTRKK